MIADVFAAMGRRARHALLVGGAVPGLLEDIALSGAPGHAGTIDADILLDPNVFGSDDYATLAERLLKRVWTSRATLSSWTSSLRPRTTSRDSASASNPGYMLVRYRERMSRSGFRST
ncbi:hypothetical protein [Candidatus Palauibacter sp.]|uniref:hypothetical protein n=1 Tax=Candidatus Palauibacter sp. TaxID=3101350 RepID=UPI003B5B80D0